MKTAVKKYETSFPSTSIYWKYPKAVIQNCKRDYVFKHRKCNLFIQEAQRTWGENQRFTPRSVVLEITVAAH